MVCKRMVRSSLPIAFLVLSQAVRPIYADGEAATPITITAKSNNAVMFGNSGRDESGIADGQTSAIRQKETEIEILKAQLEEANERLATKERSTGDSTSRLRNLVARIDALEKASREKIASYEKEIAELKAGSVEKNIYQGTAGEKDRIEINKLKTELAGAKDALSRKIEEVAAMDRDLSRVKEEKNSAQAEAASFRNALSEKSRELSSVLEAHASLKKELDTAMAGMNGIKGTEEDGVKDEEALSVLESKVRDGEETISSLKEEIVSSNIRAEKYLGDIEAAKKEIERYKEDISRLLAENAKYQERIDALDKERTEKDIASDEAILKVEAAEREASAYKEDLSAAQAEVRSNKERIDALKNEIAAGVANIKKKEDIINGLTAEIDSERKKALTYAGQTKEYEAKIKRMEEDLARMIDASGKKDEEMTSLRAEIDDLRKIEEQKETTRDSLSGELEIKKKELANFVEGFEAYKEKYAAEVIDREKEIENLRNDLAAGKSKLEDARKELDKERGALRNKDARIKELEGKLSSMEALAEAKSAEMEKGLSEHLETIKVRNEEIGKLNEKIGSFQEQFKTFSDAKDSEVALKDSEIERLTSEVRGLKDVAISKDKEINALKKNMSGLEGRIKENSMNYAKELDALKVSIETISKEKEDMAAELKSKADEVKTLTESQEEMNVSLEAYKKDVTSGVAEISELKARLGRTDDEMKTHLAEYEKEIAALEAELEEKNAKMIELDSSLSSYKEQFISFSEEKDKEIAAQKDKITSLEKENAVFSKERMDLKDKESRQAGRINELERETGRIKDKAAKIISKYKEEVETLEARSLSVQSQLTQAQQEAEALRDEKARKELEKDERTAQFQYMSASLKRAMRKTIDAGEVAVSASDKGVKVSVLSDVLFGPGSADISSGGKSVLSDIGNALQKSMSGNKIVIEGHTDNVPIRRSGWKSNWDLSSQRAISVLHYFTDDLGMTPDDMRVTGYGQYRPIADNSTEEGRNRNRRVEILVLPVAEN